MIVYVGYVLADYAHAILMGTNHKKVKEELKACCPTRPGWVRQYVLKDDEVIKLDCD